MDVCGHYWPNTAGPSIVESPAVLEAILAETPQSGVFVEIGTWGGATAAWIADRRPGMTVLSVDSFASVLCRLLWIVNRRPNMQLFAGDSATFYSVAREGFAVAVFVDGDHTEKGVLADLRGAERIVMPGGAIMGHDYRQPGIPGVALAVDRFCADTGWRVTKQVASMVVLRREASR
jgi:predicted O-methyltransferase YrrM